MLHNDAERDIRAATNAPLLPSAACYSSNMQKERRRTHRCVAVRCSVLWRAAVCCNVLQRVAAFCSVLQYDAVRVAYAPLQFSPACLSLNVREERRMTHRCVPVRSGVLQWVTVY